MAARKPRVNIEEGFAHRLREGEIFFPVAGIDIIIKNPADAARLIPVFQEKILIAPFFVFGIIFRIKQVTGGFESGMKFRRIFFIWKYTYPSTGRARASKDLNTPGNFYRNQKRRLSELHQNTRSCCFPKGMNNSRQSFVYFFCQFQEFWLQSGQNIRLAEAPATHRNIY